jgi:hypothetical protein
MKIKVLVQHGSIPANSIIDAVVSLNTNQAAAFDYDGVAWFYSSGQFEIVKEQETNSSFKSLRDLLGQDIKSLEFK